MPSFVVVLGGLQNYCRGEEYLPEPHCSIVIHLDVFVLFWCISSLSRLHYVVERRFGHAEDVALPLCVTNVLR